MLTSPDDSHLPSQKFFEAMRLPKHLESLPPGFEDVFKVDPEKEKTLLRDGHVAPIKEDIVFHTKDLQALRVEYEALMRARAAETAAKEVKQEIEEDGKGERIIEMIGPTLPPHLAPKESPASSTASASGDSEVSSTAIVPTLLPHLAAQETSSASIGPALPPHLISHESSSPSIGPTLPPHLLSNETSAGATFPDSSTADPTSAEDDSPRTKKIKLEQDSSRETSKSVKAEVKEETESDAEVGPSLPAEVTTTVNESAVKEEDDDSFGPALPPSMQADSDDDNYGPQLPQAGGEESYESRFIKYKIKEAQQRKDNTKREEWMLKCPTKNKSYLPFSSDKSFGATVQSKEVDSSESLMDKHQRKRKKEADVKSKEPQERKAFNRDEEMSMMAGGKKIDVNKLREHMGSLDSRFASSGSSSKFL
ncbi:hypothetical protein QR680_007924 [Steinernema hermaphroditum]|uniref:Uncharacterized protein n=1 Tax=Steinernema hermaphroditum TaxID=289476 RepID=A0AA39IH34_9BILA|nr:hypothetical protein QR680_007924 [Steinernema hermaphroditum]